MGTLILGVTRVYFGCDVGVTGQRSCCMLCKMKRFGKACTSYMRRRRWLMRCVVMTWTSWTARGWQTTMSYVKSMVICINTCHSLFHADLEAVGIHWCVWLMHRPIGDCSSIVGSKLIQLIVTYRTNLINPNTNPKPHFCTITLPFL